MIIPHTDRLSCGPSPPRCIQMEAKLKYSRFKAASLSKAFKAGTVPQAGPPTTSATAEPAPTFPSPPTASSTLDDENQPRSADTWSNAATPGAVDDDRSKQLGEKRSFPDGDEDEVEGVLFPSTPGSGKGKEVRFAGVGDDDEGIQEGLPAFPVPPVEEDEGLDAPSAPPMVDEDEDEAPAIQPLHPPTPDKPAHVHVAPMPPSDLAPPPQPPTFTSAPPPAPIPSAPAAAPRAAPPAPKPAPPPAKEPWAPVKRDEPLTLQEMEKVQKHAKWAISALNYEDVETAKKELREALRLLG